MIKNKKQAKSLVKTLVENLDTTHQRMELRNNNPAKWNPNMTRQEKVEYQKTQTYKITYFEQFPKNSAAMKLMSVMTE